MFRPERDRAGSAGNLERDVGEITCGLDIGRRDLRAELDAIGPDDLEQRCAFAVRGAERREHVRDATRDGRSNRERVARRGAATAAQRFVALLEPGVRGAEPRFRGGHGAPGVLGATRGNRSIGEQAFRARLLRAGAVERHVRLRGVRREGRVVVGTAQPRLEPSERLTRPDGRSNRDERVSGESPGGRRGDDRFTAREGLDHRGHLD